VETATVAASYPADIAKNERVQALLASGNMTSSGTSIITIVNNTGTAIKTVVFNPTNNPNNMITFYENIENKSSKKIALPPTDSSQKYSFHLLTSDNIIYSKDNIIIKSDVTLTFNQSDKISLPEKTTASPSVSSYKIGDTGPAGGIIFYDKGNNRDGWRYLEAAPASTEKTAPTFWASDLNLNGGRKVGDGKENTKKYLVYFDKKGGGINSAAWLCNDMNINGFNDWYLPSLDELLYMYNNLYSKGLGNFKNLYYWSSSSGGTNIIDFSEGKESNIFNPDRKCQVRAVRQF